jgi:2-polyprenyl-3-methyl-5-hydroxy-6-metoxy-1,4-benzoquinol methylase
MGSGAIDGDNPSTGAQRAYWDERWETQRSPNDWQKQRAQAILAMVQGLSLDSPRILDLGCATGWMTKLLSELGPAEGVDLSEAAIAIAKSQYPGIQFTAGDLYEIPLTSDPVDLVVCQEVIAHVSDQPLLIRRISEVIKPGGYLIITAANKFVMDRMRDSDGIVGVGPEDPDEHIKKWLDMKGLKRLLEPYFTVNRTTSVIPIGERGWLRVINSHKLNKAVGRLISQRRLKALKERMGFGYSIIAIGQKKS